MGVMNKRAPPEHGGWVIEYSIGRSDRPVGRSHALHA